MTTFLALRPRVFCAALLFGGNALAQQTSPSYRNRVLGVYDIASGEPIESAEVSDLIAKTSALTTKTGTVSLAFLPDGGAMVRIRKVGYTTETMAIAISPADTTPVTVLLTKARELPAVVTTDSAARYLSPGLRAFEERRASGMGGYFIPEAELRKSDGKTTMTNLLRRVPGMRIRCITAGGRSDKYGIERGMCIAEATRVQSKYAILGGACDVQLYFDGAKGSETEVDLQRLHVEDFAAIEYYAGASVPAQYNMTGSTCGVLFFWSRER